jgi:hypothetical protein
MHKVTWNFFQQILFAYCIVYLRMYIHERMLIRPPTVLWSQAVNFNQKNFFNNNFNFCQN